jgi:glutamyl/glutaminyl-tRNA synthetase
MNRIISWFHNISLRQIITVFLASITFLVIPAFTYSQSYQAKAETLIAGGDSYTVDSTTIKRIQERAEDLGDSPERPIGDTGLKNIKNLGENIPETLGMRARQDTKDATGRDPSEALDEAQNQAKGVVEGVKQAVKNVID